MDVFTPALYQPPSGWFPGGKYVDTVYTPALQDDRAPGLMPGPPATPTGKYAAWDCPNWLDPRMQGTTGYYPNALIAYPHWAGLRHRPFPTDGFLLGDSGGFSIMTKGLVIDPRDVIKWQIRERCSAGVVLDVPPTDLNKQRILEEALGKTLRNINVALPYYREHREAGGAFRWWGVVHGWRTEELEHWWQETSNVYPFTDAGEGWAFKPRPNIKPATVARVLHFIRTHDTITKAHFLMTTGISAVAVLMALGEQAGLDFVSYDSTTFTRNATNRLLMVPDPDALDWEVRGERADERHVRDYILNECACASCAMLREDVKRYPDLLPKNEKWSGYWVFRFAYHNLLATHDVFTRLRAFLKGTPDGLSELLGKAEAAQVYRAFDGEEAFVEDTGTSRGLLDFLE